MKITPGQLRRIIKEEITKQRILKEYGLGAAASQKSINAAKEALSREFKLLKDSTKNPMGELYDRLLAGKIEDETILKIEKNIENEIKADIEVGHLDEEDFDDEYKDRRSSALLELFREFEASVIVDQSLLNDEQKEFLRNLLAMNMVDLKTQYSDITKEKTGRRSSLPDNVGKDKAIKEILDVAYPELGLMGYGPAQISLSLSDMIKNRLGMNEAMSRITPDEVAAWKSGNWSYVSGDGIEDDMHRMDSSMAAGDDPNRFLHGEDPHDDEGSMVKSRLYSMKQMAADVCGILNPDDQLPGWVQDHISVAHENLQQVHGYLMGQQHAREKGMTESKRKKNLSEAHNRVTREEMDAWMRGDWGFVSEDLDEDD